MLPLDPEPAEIRAMGEAVVDALASFVAGLDDAPADRSGGALEVARAIGEEPPERGRPFGEVLDEAMTAIAEARESAGPGYLAYIPGGGLPSAALADLLARGVNRFPSLWMAAPGAVRIEEDVARWFCRLFGMPEGSQGILTTGGSIANLSAVVAARHAKLGDELGDARYYVSEQAHASVTKAATISGFTRTHLRLVPTDGELRMDPEALRDAIREDRRAGARPFLVVSTAGTTNTGAVDPLEAIADVAAEEELWLHVDAAYGGSFQLTERGRERFRGIERADSVTVDPHKGMFLPYGTGALVVRDGEALHDAHFEGAAYLQDSAPSGELPNYSEYSTELSRDWRGLRVWLPLQLHGVAAFREALDEKLDLAEMLDAAFREDPNLELPWATQLTVTPFRLRGGDDAANEELLRRINASKRVFLSSTRIDGRFTLRVCILSHRTHRDRIEECIAIVRDAAAGLAP